MLQQLKPFNITPAAAADGCTVEPLSLSCNSRYAGDAY